MRKGKILALIVGFLVFLLLHPPVALVASTVMSFMPHSGSFGKPFSVNLIIDGHSDKFNAAQATVSLSPGLAIKNVTLGDCNFSFLRTPSVQSLSFSGVILSTYATKCTVYTLDLVPVAKGSASITLAKPAVKRYGDAANILSSISNASYTLTAALKPPAVPGAPASKSGLYTVLLSVVSAGDRPASQAPVVLNSVSGKNKQQAKTNSSGRVQFMNLQQGIYDVVVMTNNTKVGESIINVSGQNHTLTFSISLNAQKNNSMLKNTGSVLGVTTSSPYFIVGILVIGIILGVGIVLLIAKFVRRKRSH